MEEPEETRRLQVAEVRAGGRGGPRPGELFAERYRIEAELGRGGFGTVYEAHDTLLGRPVAIKILSRGQEDPLLLARFLQEARAAAGLASEHVVSVHDIVVPEAGAPFLVMELLRGADLHDELAERGPMPVAAAVDLVLEAALGLAHAHARGIVHRDLKPRNLFLAQRPDGTRVLKVLDFGMARWATSEVTETGAAIGTPRYMAPEQLRSSRAVDARADIWSLGVVCYELFTGAPIVDAESPLQFAAQILVEPHVPLQVRAPSLPDRLARVVDRCLAKDPAHRFADLAAFAAALTEFAGDARELPARIERVLRPPAAIGLDQTVARGAAAQPTPSARLTRRWRWVGAALIVAVALSIAVTWGRGLDRVRTRSSPGESSTARLAPPSPVASPEVAPPPQEPSTPVMAVPTAPTVRAPTPVPAPRPAGRPRPTKPTAAEVAAINDWCLNNGAARELVFLVPGQGGGSDYVCGAVARLGCARLVHGCRTEVVTDAERKSCRYVLAGLRAAGACR